MANERGQFENALLNDAIFCPELPVDFAEQLVAYVDEMMPEHPPADERVAGCVALIREAVGRWRAEHD